MTRSWDDLLVGNLTRDPENGSTMALQHPSAWRRPPERAARGATAGFIPQRNIAR
jgi:hypothetical protein